ncbi:hypothetical protein BDR22DRAFT_304707 [Usnea florida]
MDGCDVPNGNSNHMNWKHGGSMKDNNEITYTIAPNANRAPAPEKPLGSCESRYNGFWATFIVYGSGWADSDFGRASGGVLAQLKGCDAVTGWNLGTMLARLPMALNGMLAGKLPIGTRRLKVSRDT